MKKPPPILTPRIIADMRPGEEFGDPYTAMSLRLQAAFGLRRAESIEIQPAWADRGDRLVLRPSWCKGGREREIPIRTAAQDWLLRDAKALAGRGSLIPADSRFVEQLHRFTYQCSQAGIHHVMGIDTLTHNRATES